MINVGLDSGTGDQVEQTEDASSDADRWIEACWLDMRQRAEQGQSFSAVEYLSKTPPPTFDEVTDLLYGEIVVRRQRGEPIDRQSFLAQHPLHAKALYKQLAFDDALGDLDADDFDGDDFNPGHSRGDREPQAVVRLAERADGGPERFGRYAIVDQLGCGAQAWVYRAYDPQLKRDVVVKIEPPVDTAVVTPFSRAEAVISANLNHPNLSPTLDAGLHEGRRYIVSRFIEGNTFDQWVRAVKPSEREIATVIATAARAISHAHNAATLHLDIKPRNIVIDRQRQPHVIDFGLAQVHDVNQQLGFAQGTVRGTLAYMSPEQARGDTGTLCNATDVFALTATLMTGLIGQPPYPDCTLADLERIKLGQWLREPLERSIITPKMKAIVRKGLAADPKDRYHTMDQLATDLESIALSREPHVDYRRIIMGLVVIAAGLLAVVLLWRGSLNTVATDSNLSLQLSTQAGGGLFVPLSDRGLLRTGEAIRISGQVPAAGTAVLFAVSPSSDLQILHLFEQTGSPTAFSYPLNTAKAILLTGGPGTEIIGLAHGADAESVVRALQSFADTRSQPLPITASVVRCTLGTLVFEPAPPTNLDDGMPKLASEQLAGYTRDLGPQIDIEGSSAVIGTQLSSLSMHLGARGIILDVTAFSHVVPDR